MPLVHEKLVPDPRPEPGAGRPFLASARLTVPVLAPKLGKGMVNKMKQLHADLNLPARPLPTQVRHDGSTGSTQVERVWIAHFLLG